MPLLNWSDRDEDLTRSALTPYRLLEPVASLSYGEVDSPNMLIEGDNLDALKDEKDNSVTEQLRAAIA